MSSDPVSTFKHIAETYGYTAVIIFTIVGYDYILTFSREIDTVWRRPWTWVSTLFLIIRYVGLCWTITLGLAGTSFVPGPVDVSVSTPFYGSQYQYEVRILFQGITIVAVGDWGYMIFLAAADIVMILRVTALWNQSRIILGILLLIYVPQMAITIVWDSVYTNPGTTLAVGTYQVFNLEVCTYSSTVAPKATYRAIPRFILGSALLILAVIPTLRQSVEMYKVTKRWQTNRTMELLVREGAVYFIVNMLFNIINAIQLPIADLMMILNALGYALSYAVMPRFIISIRELYDRDLRERWQGIDTGFGRHLEQSSSRSQGVSTIALADVILGPGRADDVEGIELGETADGTWRV